MISSKVPAVFFTLALASCAQVGAVVTSPGKQIELLNRGAVAIQMSGGVFVSWRLLATDAGGVALSLVPPR